MRTDESDVAHPTLVVDGDDDAYFIATGPNQIIAGYFRERRPPLEGRGSDVLRRSLGALG